MTRTVTVSEADPRLGFLCNGTSVIADSDCDRLAVWEVWGVNTATNMNLLMHVCGDCCPVLLGELAENGARVLGAWRR